VISFRYHLVSIAAVLLALAAGVALGAGPLSESAKIAGGKDSTVISADLTELQGFEAAYAKKTGGALVSEKLKGTSVVFFTLPGSHVDQIEGLESAFAGAGASVVGRVALEGQLVDSKGRQFAEGVAQQATKDVKGVSTDGESYARIGSALGRAFLATKTVKPDAAASTISSAFSEGGLIRLEEKPTSRAQLAVIVAGPEKADSDLGQGEIAAALADAFDLSGQGSLFVGPSASSDEDGYVEALRASDAAARVSSVDVIDAASGRLVATLVAARELGGNAGAFGTSRSADGAIPN